MFARIYGCREPPEFPPSIYVTLQSAEEFSVERGSGGTYQSQGNPPVLASVSPGRYWVQVQPSQSGIYVASATSGGKDLLRTPLVVPFGASVPPIEVTVRNDPAEIDATVDGRPSPVQLCNSGRHNRLHVTQ